MCVMFFYYFFHKYRKSCGFIWRNVTLSLLLHCPKGYSGLLTVVTMTYNELYRKLRKAGYFLLRHGRSHDIWQNPVNGKWSPVPLYGTEEVPKGTLNSIYQRLGL